MHLHFLSSSDALGFLNRLISDTFKLISHFYLFDPTKGNFDKTVKIAIRTALDSP